MTGLLDDGRVYHSTYKGWTIETKDVHGLWLATRLGELSLRADTLGGLKRYITDVNEGGRR